MLEMATEGIVDVYNVFEVDTTKPWQILSHYFPDKVGGKPAWLSLKPLPSPEDLKCGRCGKPCMLLLQKYAPKETMHRMIFIFLCRDPACCRENATDNFIVLRSQLRLINDFYPETPPDEDYFDMSSAYPRASSYTSLCVMCGCAGPKFCGKCHKMSYCSKEHQTSHWKSGHRLTCGQTLQGSFIHFHSFNSLKPQVWRNTAPRAPHWNMARRAVVRSILLEMIMWVLTE